MPATDKQKLRDVLAMLALNPKAVIEIEATDGPPLICKPQDVKLTSPGSTITLDSVARFVVNNPQTWEKTGVIGEILVDVTAVVNTVSPFSIGFDSHKVGHLYHLVIPFRVLLCPPEASIAPNAPYTPTQNMG